MRRFFVMWVVMGLHMVAVAGGGDGIIRSGAIWPDDQGVHINAHGGGILLHNGTYYWFGEHKAETTSAALVGVTCYASEDLTHWRNCGVALSVSDEAGSDIERGCVLERPKVIYNAATRKFVMWFHLELKGQGYNAARYGVAVADRPEGPYRFLYSQRAHPGVYPMEFGEKEMAIVDTLDIKNYKEWWTPSWYDAIGKGLFVKRDLEGGQMSRDMTLYVDDDGKAYHIFSSEDNLTLHIAELTDDYLHHSGRYTRMAPAGHNEAPAIFKKDGTYWMITSGCTGWEPNEARMFSAPSIWGPWTQHPNPCRGPNAEKTFGGQSTYVLKVGEQFIFMADIWRPQHPIDARYIWLPIEFENGLPVVRWKDEWRMGENGEATSVQEGIDLSGEWLFARDNSGWQAAQVVYGDQVMLPGTMDTNRKGDAPTNLTETTHLTRVSGYVGRAWYKRTVQIPKAWKKKHIVLTLERTKPAEVYVDGKWAGSSDDISTPQRYDLSGLLTPGEHEIAIMVDNGETVPPQLLSNSHAYTEDTQTNWNGIIGEISLTAYNALRITDLQVMPDVEHNSVGVSFAIEGKIKKNTSVNLSVTPELKNGLISSLVVWPARKGVWNAKDEQTARQTYSVVIPLKGEKALWDEFTPDRYVLTAQIDDGDMVSVAFGLTDFRVEGSHFSVNGKETFLRGKHDACVFPITGHVPMDVETWTRYLLRNMEYGINHIRFHSWCPPEAAFEAADRLGIYLQPELPFWGDFNKDDERLMTFLHKEGENIIREYGHHPSFVMFALGNELWGSVEKMGEFVSDFRTMAPKKLFTFGSNYYLGYQGVKPGMDYFTTCRVGGEEWGTFTTHTRGSFSFADAYNGGILNSTHPNTMIDLEEGCARSTVPVISHETAQFQTYPDYDEIRKYTGVLYPYNMEVFRQRLENAGMADQAKAFHMASGKWSLQLYKADIEMDLRTEDMAGFQLLDLQDYPGQGSAYVGILDAFMDSKGLTTPWEWRQWCSRVVPLLETEKFCYTADESLCALIKIANFSGGDLSGTLHWALTDDKGNDVVEHSATFDVAEGLDTAGEWSVTLAALGEKPNRYDFRVWIEGSQARNRWPIWVYPAQEPLEPLMKDIVIARQMTPDVASKLENGASVLLMPDSTQCGGNTVGGLFQTDYWNYRMFKTISENNKKAVSPGTLGLLMDPKHPMFESFPTEMHTNWQWFPVVVESTPFMLDNTAAAYRPIVQVIDNIERNHKLGLVFEFAVGKGKLLVVMSDLQKAAEYVEGKQFYLSVLRYMHSDSFAPKTKISADDFRRLLTTPVVEGKIGELNNISPY